jgi:hypothetical protein
VQAVGGIGNTELTRQIDLDRAYRGVATHAEAGPLENSVVGKGIEGVAGIVEELPSFRSAPFQLDAPTSRFLPPTTSSLLSRDQLR